jgi:hypothetical protein|tara:strand:+ start:346 stop:561 length:216 start_codon:yes stop_codon:yes gene_type:complete
MASKIGRNKTMKGKTSRLKRCEAWLKEAIDERDRLAETGTQIGEYLQACKDVEYLEIRLSEAKDNLDPLTH